jgi:hypothetical protein
MPRNLTGDPFASLTMIFEAVRCPHCSDPVISVARGASLALADKANLTAIPEGLSFVGHSCPGYLADQEQRRRMPR